MTLRLAWSICGRHRAAFSLLGLWYAFPWFAGALGVDLKMVLWMSWICSVPFALFMYQATAGSHLLGILPLSRREVWQLTCATCVVAPALLQVIVALIVWLLAPIALPLYASRHLVGIDTLLLGGLYSLVVLQLVIGAMALFRHRRRLGRGRRRQDYRLMLPDVRLINRLTGAPRILLVNTALGLFGLGASVAVVLTSSSWMESESLVSIAARELRTFAGDGSWQIKPGDTFVFTPMWIIGFMNVWMPLTRQLRVLPMTHTRAAALFLAAPLALWVAYWMLLLATYTLMVGGPITPRFELLLAVAGTSTLANVIGLRWRNRFFGFAGMAFVYGFWFIVTMAAVVGGIEATPLSLTLLGAVCFGAATALSLHTFRHATSSSPAYQGRPKFFDAPSRS